MTEASPQWSREGTCSRPFTGVYSVGHSIAHPRERAMAAVLACGPGALLSHLWALWNFGLVGLPGHPPDVTRLHAEAAVSFAL